MSKCSERGWCDCKTPAEIKEKKLLAVIAELVEAGEGALENLRMSRRVEEDKRIQSIVTLTTALEKARKINEN